MPVTTIAIVDYGMGNFHSVARALRYAAPDADIRICNHAAGIDAADRVVFPGQGAMADCMRTLNESGLARAVVRAARAKPLRSEEHTSELQALMRKQYAVLCVEKTNS